jgi:ubiquinone/menaquinone biosynthesis C-methylase UbiE
VSTAAPATYAIRGGEDGARRLDLLAHTLAPTTEALLELAGMRPGMRCLDLGCGGGHVSRCLAGFVGTTGVVVGLDFDPVKLQHAIRASRESGLANTEFRAADVTAWREQDSYDLAYGRFILSHLADRAAMLARLFEVVRPGGTLVLEDIDFSGSYCWPANEGYAAYCRLYESVIRRRGGDANAGGQLYGLCRDAGFEEVQVRIVQPVHDGRCEAKALSLITLVNVADAVLAEGLATADELEAAIADLRAFTDDPRTLVGFPRIFQVWGRRPSAPSRPVG